MKTTKLSSKGQIIIPKHIRKAHQWEIGQELIVVDVGDGILLKPKTPFEMTEIDDVASCLKYSGRTITNAEMEAAIKEGAMEHINGSD